MQDFFKGSVLQFIPCRGGGGGGGYTDTFFSSSKKVKSISKTNISVLFRSGHLYIKFDI